MKPDEVESYIAALPATKPPEDFTGKGLEIIGEPVKSSGEIWYQDGRFMSLSSASLAFDPSSAPKRLRSIAPAQEIAWLNLSRKHRIEHGSIEQTEPCRERQDQADSIEAHRLAFHFANAILEGRLTAFWKQIDRAVLTERKTSQSRKESKEPRNGYLTALFDVALNSSHPNEITASAVMDFLKSNPDIAKHYRINNSMLNPKEVRKNLKGLGFSWIPNGRGRGQKRGC